VTATPLPGGWGATATCGATEEACAPGTVAVCDQYPTEVFDVTVLGTGATEAEAIGIAASQCNTGDPTAGAAWRVLSTYIFGDSSTCDPLLTQGNRKAKAGLPCN
jgi:hypothetical protein